MAPIAPPSGWRYQAALGLAQRTYFLRSRSSSPLGQPVEGPGRFEPTCVPWHLRWPGVLPFVQEILPAAQLRSNPT